YVSLGWDIQNCIPGFVDNLQAGNITSSVTAGHKIPDEWVSNVVKYRIQIQELLEKNVNYQKIKSEKLTDLQLKTARAVRTNLSTLSMEQINCLSSHGAN